MNATMHSSGNSFIVCMVERYIGKHDVAALCAAQSVDGMVQVIKNGSNRYKLAFFNNDGNSFKMCFNGSLCAAFFVKQLGKVSGDVQFFTENFEEFEARFLADKVALIFHVPPVEIVTAPVNKPGLHGTCYSLSLTDSHKVIVSDENFFDSPAFTPLAISLRAPDDIFPEGANVHFIHVSGDAVYVRHFEKGIEKETLSCGSGCVAAAIILDQNKEIEFISPGGKLCIKKHTEKEWMISGTPCLISLSKL